MSHIYTPHHRSGKRSLKSAAGNWYCESQWEEGVKGRRKHDSISLRSFEVIGHL